MIFCATCGNKLTEDSNFCDKCGTPTIVNTMQTVPAQPTNSPERRPEAAVQSINAPVSFFDLENYVIDEKISTFKFTNAYMLFDSNGNQIGVIEQQKVSGGAKAARLLLGSSVKALQSFKLDIKDMNDHILASVERNGVGSSGISLFDSSGNQMGSLKFKLSFMATQLEILDSKNQVVGKIQGDWKGWNFTITDNTGNEIGIVNKKWNGAMKEVFTTADKYHVSISPKAVGAYRPTIVAAAIVLDMVLKESK